MTLLVLLVAGGWLWHQANAGLSQIEGELQAAVEASQWQAQGDSRLQAKPSGVTQENEKEERLPAGDQVQLHDLQQDWAIVRVTTMQGERSYRQTLLFRRGASGWYATPPSADLCGEPRTLETTYFIFHYFALDSKAVNAAAAKLDLLYSRVAVSYLPLLTPGNKRVIWVSPQHAPAQAVTGVSDDALLVISSPSVHFLLPVEISESEWLVQVVLLRLLDNLVVETIESNIPDHLRHSQAEQQLRALLYSIQLWQAWSTDLPLAPLRKPVVQGVYSDTPNNERILPVYDARLCDLHRLWNATPVALQIPLFCGEAEPRNSSQTWRYLYTYPWHLADRSIFTPFTPSEPEVSSDLAAMVGLATVVEYAATTYGLDSVSTLVANTPYHSKWETLIPASFGISYGDFEEGWQAHLRDYYGVSASVIP